MKADGEQAGGLIGPNVNGNPYKMDFHEWYPFEKSIADLRYKSFDEHERTLGNWSVWVKDWLFSRHYTKLASKKGIDDKVFAEGVVFYSLKRKAEGKVYMAKLRRDMFDWFYDKIEIFNYNVRGQDEIEDQEKFD